jgi:hypothetical protein
LQHYKDYYALQNYKDYSLATCRRSVRGGQVERMRADKKGGVIINMGSSAAVHSGTID